MRSHWAQDDPGELREHIEKPSGLKTAQNFLVVFWSNLAIWPRTGPSWARKVSPNPKPESSARDGQRQTKESRGRCDGPPFTVCGGCQDNEL